VRLAVPPSRVDRCRWRVKGLTLYERDSWQLSEPPAGVPEVVP
jgi:hypothetical protein